MSVRRAQRYQQGITLVETLVALTLITLIAGASFGVLRSGQMSWQRVEGVSREQMQVQGAYNALQRLIQQIQPVYKANAQGHPTLDFDGQASTLAFVGPVGAMAGERNYRARLHPQDGRLLLSARPLLVAEQAAASVQSWPLIDEVEGVRLSYWGRANRQLEARWHDRWQAQPLLPERVRVELRHDGVKHQWVFALPVAAGADAGRPG